MGQDEIRDPNWFIEKFITPTRTKHYFHLRYLSSKHDADKINLRLTGKPLSFIFGNYIGVGTAFKM